MEQTLIITLICLCCIICKSQNDTILVDFGSTIQSSLPWNNILNSSTGSIGNVFNSNGFFTSVSVAITDGFTGTNSDGTVSPNPTLAIPSSASSDSFFGNTSEFNGVINPQAEVTLNNLDPTIEYEIQLFASRLASDNRETEYRVTGASSSTHLLQVSSNTSEIVSTMKYPDANGQIKIAVSVGPNNNNGFGFYYLGTLKLIYPEQTILTSLELISPNGGEFWQVGKTPQIQWNSQGISTVDIEYSINNGVDWLDLGSYNALSQAINWTVPNTVSSDCLVRIVSGTLLSESDAIFEISDDQSECPIVVLGSSTAAGVGPSSPDSAWVNRFTQHVFQQSTKYTTINLALGGMTTYNILPTGAYNPTGLAINQDRNLTAALAYNPAYIIINMPSNDTANGISESAQLANFDMLYSFAACDGVQTWICTTQPRAFNPSQVQIQRNVRDSILLNYGDYAIDFWTGFADEVTGFILPHLDSGDGVHMNDQAHRILEQRVYDQGIQFVDCAESTLQASTVTFSIADLDIFPNNGQAHISIDFLSNSNGDLELELYDIEGVNVSSFQDIFNSSGQHIITWDLPTSIINSPVFSFVQITIKDSQGIRKHNFDLGCINILNHDFYITVK